MLFLRPDGILQRLFLEPQLSCRAHLAELSAPVGQSRSDGRLANAGNAADKYPHTPVLCDILEPDG
jgi:hypothetical protein